MSESEAQIEQHNRSELWKEVAGHLRIAEEEVGRALMALEDIGSGAIGVAPMLANLPTVAVRLARYRRMAEGEL